MVKVPQNEPRSVLSSLVVTQSRVKIWLPALGMDRARFQTEFVQDSTSDANITCALNRECNRKHNGSCPHLVTKDQGQLLCPYGRSPR